MTSLAIAIVAHPLRAKRAAELADTLGAHIVMDDAEYGDAINHARAWEWLAGQDAEWVLCIEDDAVPVENMRDILQREALPHAPYGLISLYVGTDLRQDVALEVQAANYRASRSGAAWINLNGLYWGVAILGPRECAPGIAKRLRRYEHVMSDTTVSRWARRNQVRTYGTYPSLVDHEDESSVMGHGKRGPRKALEVGVPKGWAKPPA